MQQFTGMEYVKIDVANQYGLDKLTWDERIEWVNTGMTKGTLFEQENLDKAKNPVRFLKALRALTSAISGKPSGHLVGLDATASGLQIMACLMGCKKTASMVNLIDTGKREDAYQSIASEMGRDKAEMKHPIMTVFYGSKAQPREVFGKDTPELEEFYEILNTELPGAMECMNDIQECWQPYAKEHSWTLPDGHRAIVKVDVPVDKRIEIDELDNTSFTFRTYINEGTKTGLSLAANIVQSIDGYIVREMVRRAYVRNFDVISIHDDFMAHPNYMDQVRIIYRKILSEIAQGDLLGSILSEVTGEKVRVHKMSDDLHTDILKSEYALS